MEWKIKEITIDEEFLQALFLFSCLFLFCAYVYFATKTQPLGEDEITYMRISKEIYQGRFTGFTSDGHPVSAPLMLSIISSGLFSIFGVKLAVLKAISTIFGFFSLIFIYFAVKKTKGIMPAIVASSLMLSIFLFSHLLMLAYVETLIMFFSSLIIFLLTRGRSISYGILLGITIALSLFAKHSAMMFIPILLIYFFWSGEHKLYKKYIIIAMLIPILVWGLFAIHNILTYKIPAIFGLDTIWIYFYGDPYPPTSLPEFSNTGVYFIIPMVQDFGILPMLFMCVGFFYVFSETETKITKISHIAILVFLLFSAYYGFRHETRYLMIIVPFMVFGTIGYWKELQNFFEEQGKTWAFYIIILGLTVFSIKTSVDTVLLTSRSQRWNPSYVQGLYWLRDNTTINSTVFTAYGGSVYYYAERDYTWVTSKFPEIMTTTNSTIIYNDLLEQKADYIYLWQGIVADNYVVPQSNLFGVFTTNFLNVVSADKTHFQQVFSNDIGVIFKVVKNESQSGISQ